MDYFFDFSLSFTRAEIQDHEYHRVNFCNSISRTKVLKRNFFNVEQDPFRLHRKIWKGFLN